MPHYDARKTLRDPNPLPRRAPPPASPITLDVEGMAAQVGHALAVRTLREREMLERVYVERLLDRREECGEP